MIGKILLSISLAISCGVASAQVTEVTDTIAVVKNGFLNASGSDKTLDDMNNSNWNMEVKNYGSYSRWGYLNFPLEKIVDSSKGISMALYLTGEKLGTPGNLNSYTSDDLGDGVTLEFYACKYDYDGSVSWSTKVEPTADNEVLLGSIVCTNDSKDTFLSIDVTDYVKTVKSEGKEYLNVRLAVKDKANITLRFRQVRGDVTGDYFPRLLQVREEEGSSIEDLSMSKDLIYPTYVNDELFVNTNGKVLIYDMLGNLVCVEKANDNRVSVSSLSAGNYILKADGIVARFIKL